LPPPVTLQELSFSSMNVSVSYPAYTTGPPELSSAVSVSVQRPNAPVLPPGLVGVGVAGTGVGEAVGALVGHNPGMYAEQARMHVAIM